MASTLKTAALALCLATTSLTAQTRITPPKNKYTVEDDVKLGKEAAADARQKFPIMSDREVTSFVESVGRRLVGAIPPEFQEPRFQYTFEAVNVREINAFALPGGPMFVNRGMLEAAHSEGEVAGVMAHEISHVVLRHGTAQASQSTQRALPSIIGAIAGAVVGGRLGTVINYGVQMAGAGYFTSFSREYEKQADLEGARIMALAGYDPREMANMFDTLAKESPGNNFEFLSDHPNPANRSEYIRKEAQSLPKGAVERSVRFEQLQAHLKTLPKAPTSEEVENGRASTPARPDSVPTGRVPAPASNFETYTVGRTFQISVPSNWKQTTSDDSVTFAPVGSHGTYRGASIFTHGVQAGLVKTTSGDLRSATDELVAALTRSNARMSNPSDFQNISIDGHRALQASMSNVSDATGTEEVIQLVTTLLNDGRLFYGLAVAPRNDYRDYTATFQRVLGSIRLDD